MSESGFAGLGDFQDGGAGEASQLFEVIIASGQVDIGNAATDMTARMLFRHGAGRRLVEGGSDIRRRARRVHGRVHVEPAAGGERPGRYDHGDGHALCWAGYGNTLGYNAGYRRGVWLSLELARRDTSQAQVRSGVN